MGTSCSATRPNQITGQTALAERPLDVAGTVDVVSAFLAQDHKTERDAVNSFVKTAALATGGQVHFYNCPFSRGRLTVVSGRPSSEDEGFFLVASSSPSMQKADAACPRHVAVLQDALENGVSSSEAATSSGGNYVAAATVKTRGVLDGILVAEVAADLLGASDVNQAPKPLANGRPNREHTASKLNSWPGNNHCTNCSLLDSSIAQAVTLWSQVLGERLENLHNRQNAQGLTKALNSILGTMEKVVDAGISGLECHAAMSHTSNMIPSEVLRGGIESDRVALWFYDCESKEVVLNNSGHLDGIRVPVDQSIVGDAVRVGNGRVICVPDVNQDSRFNRSVDERTGFCTQSTICIPIRLPRPSVDRCQSLSKAKLAAEECQASAGKELIKRLNTSITDCNLSVVQLTNGRRPGETGERIDHFDFVLAESIQKSILPTMLNLREVVMQFLEMERQKEGLQAVVSLVSRADSVTEVIALVEQEVNDVMSCECCTFFFIDEANNEVWAPPTDARPKGICVSVGEGLVGHMAYLAQTDAEQCARMMTANDPQTHPYWKGDIDSDFVTRNVMTAPVWSGGKDKRLMGLIQILNKRTSGFKSRQSSPGSVRLRGFSPLRNRMSISAGKHGTSSNESQVPGFTPADERLLQTLASGVGCHLDRLLVDMMWTKAEMDTNAPGADSKQIPVPSIMNEYYSMAGKGKTVYRTHTQHFDTSESGSTKIWSVRARLTKVGPDKDVEMLFRESEPPEHADVQQWRVDYWALSEAEEFRLFLQALRHIGCLGEMAVEEMHLHNFFFAIRKTYGVVPFHNFRHALSTLHYAFKLMTSTGCIKVLNQESQFAILVAALCHDCDHRGCNNAFEIMTRSELALRYNDNAPLESHHCARTFETALGQSTKAGNCNIFSGLNRETFVTVRQLIIAGILSTDMKHHGDHVALIQSFRLRDCEDKEQSQFLVELFLHSADISNPFMPMDISRRWATLVAEEFTLQVTKERELGLPVTTFMDGLSDPKMAAKNQVGFVDFVIHPLTDPMFRIFPGLDDIKRYLHENRSENLAVAEGKQPGDEKQSFAPIATNPSAQ